MEREPQQIALPAPRMPATPTGTQLREGSKGYHLSQASSGSSHKGDGQGSHALLGLTQ